MRRIALLAAGILCGALAVSGQDDGNGDPLVREIERMKKLLQERIGKGLPEATGRLITRTYDISDLCTPVVDTYQPLENLEPSDYEPPETEDDGTHCGVPESDVLIEIIRMNVEPASWEELEGADLTPNNGHLIVHTIPRVHEKIGKTLTWLRKCLDRRVSVEVSVVPVADADVALLTHATALTGDEARRLLARPLAAVTLTGFDGQQLGGRTGREISYVQDYKAEIAEGVQAGDPIPNKVFAGCTAEVCACLDDGDGAILSCQLELARVAEPLPQYATPHGPVELPVKRLTRVQGSFWAPLGRTVIAGGCTVGDEPCVILVTVRRR